MSRADGNRTATLRKLNRALRVMVAAGVLNNQRMATELRINPVDLQCLNVLDLVGPLSPGRISRLTGLTTGATTRMLDRLERAGDLERIREVTDRRRVVVRRKTGKADRTATPYEKVAASTNAIWSRYTGSQLSLILGLFDRFLDSYGWGTSAVMHYREGGEGE